MTTIEQRLRDLGGTVAPPPMPAAGTVMRRGRQRRFRRRGAGLAALAALGTGAGATVRALVSDDGSRDITLVDEPPTTSGDPAMRTVPDVRGLTVQEAGPVIERLGLSVDAPTNSDLGRVVAQDPAPGEQVHVGGAVRLEVAPLDRARNVDGPVMGGTLLDGRAWTVGYSSRHGLCATIGSTDLGCDDIGPSIPPDADPATPRGAADAVGNYPEEEACALVFAFLPPGAETVELVHDDGRVVTDGLVVEPGQRFWAMPVQPGDNPETVIYRDGAGDEVARFPLGG